LLSEFRGHVGGLGFDISCLAVYRDEIFSEIILVDDMEEARLQLGALSEVREIIFVPHDFGRCR